VDNPTPPRLRGARPIWYTYIVRHDLKDIQALKLQFLEYLEIEKGRSLKTVENYDHYLARFIEQQKISGTREITDESVRQFRLWLNRQNLKKNTQNYYVIAIRTFLKYLISRPPALAGEMVVLSPDRIELAKTGQRDLDLISQGELQRLLSAPDGSRENGLRDRAILELLFSTGLRVSELCNLKVDSIDFSSQRAGGHANSFSVRGKGEKVRVVFLSDSAKFHVKAYLDKQGDISRESLFGVTPRSVQRIVKHYAIKAGITRKVTPHVIRHSFATDLLSNGADLRSVQALLGHANIATTQIYTHVTDRQLGDVHKAFHGKSLGKRK